MLTSSGDRKWVHVTPMVIGGAFRDAPVMIHLFDDGEESEDLDRARDDFRDALTDSGKEVLSFPPPPAIEAGEGSDLSRRELEVLRLVALGWETPKIATDLGISRHTVRNHIRNLRHKLNAPTKLDAVVKGIRDGHSAPGKADVAAQESFPQVQIRGCCCFSWGCRARLIPFFICDLLLSAAAIGLTRPWLSLELAQTRVAGPKLGSKSPGGISGVLCTQGDEYAAPRQCRACTFCG